MGVPLPSYPEPNFFFPSRNMSKERSLIFDARLYQDLSPVAMEKSITEDLAGFVLEAGDRPIEERINVREFKIINNKIIDEETGKNVFENWKPTDELGERECVSATLFYQYLLDNPKGSLVLSISPSGGISPYKEARINVGFKKSNRDIIFYGIPSRFNPEKCGKLGKDALKLSFLDLRIDSPEDLRNKAIPILLPQGQDPWQFLKGALPLDSKVWNSIVSGLPEKLKEEARTVAMQIAVTIGSIIRRALSERDYILAGAYAERGMEQAGWKIDFAGCSGISNADLLSSGCTKDVYGNTRATTSSEGRFVRRCGNCGVLIMTVISSGYRCANCGGEYKGC